MKKTLVALAALASISAFAQSSVTISGNVDLGMQNTKQTGVGVDANDMASATTVSKKTGSPVGNGAQGWSSSQVTLNVTEDMGNGMKAGYTNEMTLSSWGAGADSANSSLSTARQSFLSLSDAKLGELRLGYQYTLDDQTNAMGRVGSANVGGRVQNFSLAAQPTPATLGSGEVLREGAQVMTAGNVVRANAIQYASPVFNGFQAKIQTASQFDDTTDSAGNSAGKGTGKLNAVQASYKTGPLTLAMSHSKITSDAAPYNAATTTAKSVNKADDFAAAYVLGDLTVVYNQYKRKTTLTLPGSDFDNDYAKSIYGAFEDGGAINRKGRDLGAKYVMGRTTLFASFGSGTYSIDYDGSGFTDIKVKARQLGATYSLSKRTSLNVYSSMTKATADGTVLASDLKKTVTGFGLAHSF